MLGRILLGIFAFGLWAALGRADDAPPSQVTRAEVIRTAERYLKHAWTARAINAFHGVDSDGIHMDTPEVLFTSAEGDPGWWKIGETNAGIPYMWGGFDTPESFDAGLLEGKAAGDMYSAEKRRLLDDGVSRHAVGIDCSGFVSRCWNLPRSYSTRELTALCEPVTDLARLRPGDVLNRHNAHVVLFLGWEPETMSETATHAAKNSPASKDALPGAVPSDFSTARLWVYEAGGEEGAKVLLSTLSLQSLLDRGFAAWRYRGIREE